MFKNEEKVKAMIVDGHRRGVCDRNGDSVRGTSGAFVAKPMSFSSAAKIYVYKNGKMVLKRQ